ncbi:PH domain-containing protein [Staphylococcus simiae]|uniref:PH domain-containing protein n=1 Tax=Staphylococcus simiae TaxID=308354 RepID=UPI001A977217|nr:PH domain-containing protein [Staphylococcus simiae]MBO1199674.1 PH domain-containing protein [Staphylococcus simiae]MBO1202143.1 PH domain-containing protein [Staphylococcus simiae]MBO1204413.1 PH domain-containing protein [Staphylococcus simiae]MBO1211711.1 PH domain-containing protein [Staphylococcus simiae]MBO1230586.1 PH domain-containing protein [Staphylococcus simiae]
MSSAHAFKKSPKSALSYYIVISIIKFLQDMAWYVIFYLLWRHFDWHPYLIYVLLLLFIISVVQLIVRPFYKYHCLSYSVDPNMIQYRSKCLVETIRTTKIERLQYLQVKTNPISRMFKLYQLVFVTAGHEVILPMLDEQQTNVIHEITFKQLRGVDEDV